MNSRLDELFSPERLRQNWQSASAPAIVPPQHSVNLTIYRQYLELQRLITKKFPDTSVLSDTLKDLSAEIDIAFGLDATLPADALQKATIVGMLEVLEELLWAMDLSQQGKL